MTSQEFRIICRKIDELEAKFNGKLDGFGKKFIGLLQGFSIIDPDRQTISTAQLCREYGVSKGTVAKMRETGILPFVKLGTAKNSKIEYRLADVAEVFSSR